jgi:hypothetical protein
MTAKTCIRTLVWLLVLLMVVPLGVFAQSGGVSPVFRQEQLDQMLAPIALYPDSLLVQVLMAATYPLEVIAANRWATANRNLSGDQFAAALDQQDWDPSVKSLVNFPSVLGMMDQKLDWTQRLGDAFLSQEDQVMDTIQQLRAKAQAQGTLQSTSQQRVVTQGQTIAIDTVDPQVIYVPVYDPFVVYGPWWYPAYPPYRYYPVGAVITNAIISFGLAVAIGAAWGYAWGGFGWSHHNVEINVYRNANFNTHINRTSYVNRIGGGGHGTWQHDPVHRKGVAYRDHNVAQRFGQVPRGNPDARRDFRGHTPDTTGPPTQTQNKRDVQERRDISGVNRSPAQKDRSTAARHAPPQQRAPAVLSGVGSSGREVKTQSDRGLASRQTVITPNAGRAPRSGNVGRPGNEKGNQPSGANVGRPGGRGHVEEDRRR